MVVHTYSHGTQEIEARRSEASGQPGTHEKLVSKTKTKPNQCKMIVYMTVKEVEPFRAKGLPQLRCPEDLPRLQCPEDSSNSSEKSLVTVLDCSGVPGCSQCPEFSPGRAVLPVFLSTLSGSSPPQLPSEGDFQLPLPPTGAMLPQARASPSLSACPGPLSMLGTVNC